MDWDAIVQFLITSGIAAVIIAALVKIILKILGDKLGWDEKKKMVWQGRLEDWAQKAIYYAEEAAKHKAFTSKEEQARFKERLAVDLVSENMGIDGKLAKAAVRAAFSLSELAAPVKFDEIARFADSGPDELIEGQGG